MDLYQHIPSPSYVLEEEKLLNNLSLLKRVQEEAGIHIICALKGFRFMRFPNGEKIFARCHSQLVARSHAGK
jgi:diaminopimelate decarboxylase